MIDTRVFKSRLFKDKKTVVIIATISIAFLTLLGVSSNTKASASLTEAVQYHSNNLSEAVQHHSKKLWNNLDDGASYFSNGQPKSGLTKEDVHLLETMEYDRKQPDREKAAMEEREKQRKDEIKKKEDAEKKKKEDEEKAKQEEEDKKKKEEEDKKKKEEEEKKKKEADEKKKAEEEEYMKKKADEEKAAEEASKDV